MSEQAATPESGALSVEQAIASLVTPPPEEQAAEPAPEAAETTETEPKGETSAPEEAEDGAETPAEAEETEAEEAEAVAPLDPPRYWSQDAKAKFAELPPELQAVVLSQEGPREEAAARAKAEAAEKVKAAEERAKGIDTLAQQLSEFLPQAVQTFQSRWGAQEPDWNAVAEEHGVEAAQRLEWQFKAEQKQLSQLAEANQKAQAEAHKAFVQTEWKALAEIAPDLAPDVNDPTKGAEKRQEVTKYLAEAGIPRDAIAQISAKEMTLAHKAMLWDRAQAALKAPPKPKPAPPARATVRPAAAAAAPNPSKQAAGRFYQAPTVENAVELLLARKA